MVVSQSYWMDSAPAPPYQPLTEDLDVDVAVVGGGIAGICTAWELSRAGRKVAVLEADQIVAGVTGHTTAKLTALHTLTYAALRGSAGAEAARLYASSQQDAVDHVAATVAEFGIDCDLERLPAYTYAESAEQRRHVQAEAAAAREAGLPASFVTSTGLPFPVAGAVRVEDQAQFHPRRYLLALAAQVTDLGGRIHEHTRVLDLHEGRPCRLTTESQAVVSAADVVVATHYPVFDRALLFTRLVPHRELVVAAPIDPGQDPGGMYITVEDHTRSVRTARYPDGRRLLVVTGESFTPGSPKVAERYERLAAWTTQRFGVDEIAYRWAAQDNHTTDRMPYVGPLHAGARHTFVATGYGGWGMTNGVMSARLLAALITGQQRPPWARLYDPRRLHPLREAAPMLRAQATVARHFVGDRIRPAEVKSPDELPPGSGAVIRTGGQRLAIYRDDGGALHSVSATCTHLGCVVAFNDAEKTWECPCHGSRFDVDGVVLHGPANRPLPAQDVPTSGP